MNTEIKKGRKMTIVNTLILLNGIRVNKKECFDIYKRKGFKGSCTTFFKYFNDIIKDYDIKKFDYKTLMATFKKIDQSFTQTHDQQLNTREQTREERADIKREKIKEKKLKMFDVKKYFENKNLIDLENKTGISTSILRSLKKGDYKVSEYIYNKLIEVEEEKEEEK